MPNYITLKLFATLRTYLPDTAEAYPVFPGMMVKDLMEQLDIPEKKAKLIFINGRKAEPETALKDGDRVGIFPPVGGG